MRARAIGAAHTRGQAANFAGLVRNHAPELGLIRLVGHYGGVETILPLPGFVRQLVTPKCMTAHDFSGSCLLEPFGRTFMCFQFRHCKPTLDFLLIVQDCARERAQPASS